MSIFIPTFLSPEEQMAQIGDKLWNVPRLWELSKNLPVMDIPLAHLNMDYSYKDLTLRQLVMHVKVAMEADLSFPIILDEDGIILEGRHRLIAAIWKNLPTVKAVRFLKNPPPDQER